MYPASVEYLNRQRIIPKLRQWTLEATIYTFFPFFSFCECVCVCFFVWFCLYRFAFTICPRVLSIRFIASFLLLFNFFIFNNYFLFFTLITFFSFFLSFFLSSFFLSFSLSFFLSFFFLIFQLSHLAERVLVLWLRVRPVPLSWESQVQDIGPPETSWLHVISKG